MTVQELLPLVKQLNKADKLRLMQTLLQEFAQDEGITLPDPEQLIEANRTYPVWSPTKAHQAANVLLDLLEKDAVTGG